MEILMSYIQLTQLVGVVVGSKTSVKETNDIALTGDVGHLSYSYSPY